MGPCRTDEGQIERLYRMILLDVSEEELYFGRGGRGREGGGPGQGGSCDGRWRESILMVVRLDIFEVDEVLYNEILYDQAFNVRGVCRRCL